MSLWFAQGLAIELPLSHVIHMRSMGCGSQPVVHPGLSEPTSLTSEKSILPSVPRGYLRLEQCKLNLDTSLEVEGLRRAGSESERLCSPEAGVTLVMEPQAGHWAGPGSTAASGLDGVTASYCRWKRAFTETLKERRWRSCLCKAFLNPAFPNYTFIIPFCIFNSKLWLLHLIMVGF